MRAVFVVVFALVTATAAMSQELLDLNTATREQLEALPGVGAKTASDIVREREENGPYGSVDDLNRVPSMTSSMLGKMRPLVKAGASDQVVITEGKVVGSETVRKVLKRYAGEPSVREVQAAAIEYYRVDPAIIDSWLTRARTNALAPQFQTRGWGESRNDLRTVTQVGEADIESNTDRSAGRLQLQATWDLDRLIFEPQEMNIAREGVRIANLRDRVTDEVTRRYFERRRLQIDLELTPPNDLADRVKKELRLQELTADMDASTGGWFGDKLKDAGRAPY
ncbi:MAG: helix-hairpin-helix domain-containing protein [Deltaproteobacteria bacterium]|nr:helix-hairpin-helix domain-containing protein [Deltaproteobacteria bacterium]